MGNVSTPHLVILVMAFPSKAVVTTTNSIGVKTTRFSPRTVTRVNAGGTATTNGTTATQMGMKVPRNIPRCAEENLRSRVHPIASEKPVGTTDAVKVADSVQTEAIAKMASV
jgi:hypothetical protein